MGTGSKVAQSSSGSAPSSSRITARTSRYGETGARFWGGLWVEYFFLRRG